MCFSVCQDPLELHHHEQNACVPSLLSALFQGKAYLLFQSPDKEWKYNLVQTQVLVEYQAKQLSFSNNSHT